MANEEQLAKLEQGSSAWNAWRESYPDIIPDLSGADLSEINLSRADLSGANLIGADLTEVDLSGADLTGANLTEASLSEVSLTEANLIGADFTGADLREAHLAKAHLGKAILSEAILSKADLSEADLMDANLSKAELTETNLSWAELSGADLSEADLMDANLSKANLYRADLSRADLRRADLSKANLARTNLWRANLDQADLTGAMLFQTIFTDINLMKTKGLDECQHLGPSFIDYLTLKYAGRLPLSFLRGCGLPDTLIDYLPLLLAQSVQYYSCLLSYSGADHDFAQRFHTDLQQAGVRCWFAPADMKLGDKTRTPMDEVIRIPEKLLLVLSESSIHSDWIEQEVEIALERERETKKLVLVPVRLDNTCLTNKSEWLAYLQRTRQIGDFTRWQDPNAYQKALNHLLRTLKLKSAINPTITG